jgi:uncharacterized membrane protein YdjX (TVP38/TMEM64 family)
LSRPWLRLLALGLLLAGLFAGAWVAGARDLLATGEGRGRLIALLHGLGDRWWVGPAFALGYAALVVLVLPAVALTLIGGAVFGLGAGILWVSVGANLGANLAFLVARRLGGPAVHQLLGKRAGRFGWVTVPAGFQGLLTLRLIPIVPFSLLNYVAGLTAIGWRDYALATGIGILPATVVYVMFAEALLAGSTGAGRQALIRSVVAGVALILFSLGVRAARRRSSGSGGPPEAGGVPALTPPP